MIIITKLTKFIRKKVRLPAEWETHSFIQVTFPHEKSDWKENLTEITACYIELIETASYFEDVLIVCKDIQQVKSYFSNTVNKFFIEIETNDTWVRDYGGITIEKNNKFHILDFIFNGWGNKYESNLDNGITQKLFTNKYITDAIYDKIDFVLEGGSIESDGDGTILTTSKCLLSKNRNKIDNEVQAEYALKKYLGAKQILWLDHGCLKGDDTDGHIDTLARFCNNETIAYVGCKDKTDEHYDQLHNMKKQLLSLNKMNGQKYNLIELPFPDACFDKEGKRLPASYANFAILNGAVLVPVYGVIQDNEALNIIGKCFPKRKTIGINCRTMIEQNGSLHCSIMQYPKGVRLNKSILR